MRRNTTFSQFLSTREKEATTDPRECNTKTLDDQWFEEETYFEQFKNGADFKAMNRMHLATEFMKQQKFISKKKKLKKIIVRTESYPAKAIKKKLRNLLVFQSNL